MTLVSAAEPSRTSRERLAERVDNLLSRGIIREDDRRPGRRLLRRGVRAVDYFGDGTRILLIAVSKYSRGGRVSHQYNDYVSILKFVERNWGLPPVTERSRDNLPNPVQLDRHPYVPVNGPAIGDLFDMFDFDH